MFQRLSHSLLKKTITRAGITKQVEATRILDAAQRVLQKHLHEEEARKAQPRYVKNRVLALELEHPAIGYLLQQKRETIIAEINNILGRPEVIRLEFLLPRREQL